MTYRTSSSAAMGEGSSRTAAVRSAWIAAWLGLLMLLGWSFALFYHLLNGIRHLFWDAGMGFDLKTIDASGLAVLGGSVALTVLAWAAGLIVMGAR